MTRSRTLRLSDAKNALDEVFTELILATAILDQAEASVGKPQYVYKQELDTAEDKYYEVRNRFEVALRRLSGS